MRKYLFHRYTIICLSLVSLVASFFVSPAIYALTTTEQSSSTGTPTPTIVQYAELCKGVTISSPTLTPNSPITITATSPSSSIKKFTFGFYNMQNLYNPANPKPIHFVSNTPFAITKDVAPTNTQTITVSYQDVHKPDTNWGNGSQTPSDFQVNAFFVDTNEHYSGPVPACVTWFKTVDTISPTLTASPTNTPTHTLTPTVTATQTPTVTATPTHQVTVTPTPTVHATLTPTMQATLTPTAQATLTPTLTTSPTQTPNASITNTITPSITPPLTTQLKLCKYEDDNGDGSYQNGENVLSWTFHYAYDNQDHTVESKWWHVWTQGCAIVDVPTGKSITVTEEQQAGFRPTGLYADGSNKGNAASYTYTSSADHVAVLWFLNTFTPSITPTMQATLTPTATPTNSITPTVTATLTATPTISPTGSLTPTASPSASPTVTLTPTLTPSPTGPTATPPASCSNLALNVKEGTAPLTVNFTGYGSDPRGAIQGYEFNFGDSSNNQQYTIQQDGNTASHTYNNAGTYTAQLRIKDSTGNWRDENGDCKRTVTVRAQGQVLGATTELPKTGAPIAVVGIVSALGWFVRKRFYIQ
jgi:hypothetical protein